MLLHVSILMMRRNQPIRFAKVRRHGAARSPVLSPYLNRGTTGTVMRGGGIGATLLALPMPLGSTIALFIPPAFAGPAAIPLIGTFPIPASPAILANEAAGAARMTRRVIAIVFALLDITMLHFDESVDA
ncbi:MAG TPA: hypothetical protein VGO01_24420 [Bradyrhizobium sp.]|nr:hypothetical protein [Bradyrhizobium sp.]